MIRLAHRTLRLTKTSLSSLLISVIGVAIIYWLLLSIMANIDAAGGRHMLFMDELISFDGTQRIFNSSNIPELVANLSGPDQRYGRSFWYVAALPTLLLEENFGAEGQIIGTRIWFSIMLLVGVALMAVSLVRKPLTRLLAISSCLCIPYIDYFSTMPKPEPIIILCMGVFIYSVTRSRQWLLFSTLVLGVAFGTKISILPAVGVFLIYAYAFSCIVFRTPPVKTFLLGLTLFSFGFLITVPTIILDFPTGLDSYLNSTWNKRGHGSDSAAVDFSSWVLAIKNSAFFGTTKLSFPVIGIQVLFPVIVLIMQLVRQSGSVSSVRELNLKTLITNEYFLPVLFSLSGVLLCLSIMLTVHRLWLFYLFIGVLFINLAFWSAIFSAWDEDQKIFSKLGLLSLMVTVGSTFFVQFDHVQQGFTKQALRSDTNFFKTAERDYNLVLDLADNIRQEGNVARTKIHLYAGMWQPPSNENSYYVPIYRPFKAWSLAPDAIILPKKSLNRSEYEFRATTTDQEVLQFFDDLERYDITFGRCKDHPCYERLEFPDSTLAALVLIRRHQD